MPQQASSYLIEQLSAVLGPAGMDQRRGRMPVTVRPADTAETAAVVKLCHATHTPIVTQGGAAGIGGRSESDGAQVFLSTARMNRIRAVDAVNNTLTVDAGVILAQAQQAALGALRYFPARPDAAGGGTVGGHLAASAGGLRLGAMRDLVLGLEVVLPDGRIWDGLRVLRQDDAGYDLRHLFVGSEGTLGVITGAVLKLSVQADARAAWTGADSRDELSRGQFGHCKSAIEMELMLRIKQAFDPNHIMNPGKLL